MRVEPLLARRVHGADPAQAPPRTALHVVEPARGANLVDAEHAATAFLVALGMDLDTESLAATPARMARAYAEIQRWLTTYVL